MHKKFIIAAAIVLGLIVVYELRGSYLNFGSSSGGSTSSNILYLTNPVTSFSGTIDKVEGNSITVSQSMILQQIAIVPIVQTAPNNPNQPPAATQITPPPTKKITFKVLVTDKTNISRPAAFVPYLLKQQSSVTSAGAAPALAQNEKLSVQDLKTGQTVSVISNVDLRTLNGSQFEAVSINASSIINSINGTVISVNGSELKIKSVVNTPGIVPGAASTVKPQEKTYTVTVDQNTEIARNTFSTDPTKPSKPEKLLVSDLKKDMQVTVYSDVDTTETTELKALLISAFSAPVSVAPPALPAATSPATASPSTSPSTAPQASPSATVTP